MNHKQGSEICRRGDDKDRNVTAGALQDLSDQTSDHHPTNRAGHTANAHNRSDCISWKHVRRRCKQIARPALVRRGRDADQNYRDPKIRRLCSKDYRHDRQRANQHRELAASVDGPTSLDQSRRKPAAADASHVCHKVDDDERRSKVFQTQAMSFVKKVRKPEEVHPPDRIGHELSDGKGPRLSMWQKPRPRHFNFGIWWIALDVLEFRPRKTRMLLGTSVKSQPRDEPQKPERPGEEKCSAPTPPDRYDRNHERRDERADVRAGIEDSSCERALLFWKPFGAGLDRGGEIAGLTEAQEETRDAKTKYCTRERVAHRRNAPEND